MQRFALIALGVADAAGLAAARSAPGRLLRGLADPADWVATAGADRAAATVAAAALELVAVWVAVGLLAALAGALPGAAGRLADRLARLVLPAALYRVAAGAAGLGVVLAAGSTAAGAAPLRPVPSAAAAAPAWPSDAPLPAPSWPVTAPAVRPTHNTPPAETPPPTAAKPHEVVVRAGDSLWSIAAAHLPRDAGREQIARSWPRWYAANRTVIGDDPDLIRPGQLLRVPGQAAEERS